VPTEKRKKINLKNKTMEEIRYIEPASFHEEMSRLRTEKKMDFLRSLIGMDWGEPAEGDAPDAVRGLGAVYFLESTETGERTAVKTSTTRPRTSATAFGMRPLEDSED
jgi:NADH:ubiquinone oxidoreductase subunit C